MLARLAPSQRFLRARSPLASLRARASHAARFAQPVPDFSSAKIEQNFCCERLVVLLSTVDRTKAFSLLARTWGKLYGLHRAVVSNLSRRRQWNAGGDLSVLYCRRCGVNPASEAPSGNLLTFACSAYLEDGRFASSWVVRSLHSPGFWLELED